MTSEQFRALLNLWMCSDPWPTSHPSDQKHIEALLDEESEKRGYKDTIGAYHEAP